MKLKRLAAIVMALTLSSSMLVGMTACGKKGDGTNDDNVVNPDGTETKASEVTVQIGPNPETLDPALNSAVDGGNMLITLFEPLLIIDNDNNVVCGQSE